MVTVVNKEPSQKVIMHTECKNCGAGLAYVPNDVFNEKYAFDYLGDHSTRSAIKCPNCNKTTGV